MMEVATRNIVKQVDVYRPDADGERLWLQGADGVGCALGEGLVGRAWQEGVPVIESTDDQTMAVAIPCLQADACRGAVVLHCEVAEDLRGAFEVWLRNDRGELGLASQWHAGLERLARITQYIKFPRNAGLPGRVWDDRFPRVLGALQDSKHFIRVSAARSEKLISAIGIPFMRRPPELDGTLLILNAQDSPIAKAMEVWARDLETGQLKIVSADYGPYATLAAESRSLVFPKGEGIAGRVFGDSAPFASNDLLGVEFPRGEKMVECGFERGIGLPIFVGSDLVASVNLYM